MFSLLGRTVNEMSDYCTDAAFANHFADYLSPQKQAIADALESFWFAHRGEKVSRRNILDFLKNETDVASLDEKWLEKYMRFLSVRGLVEPVFGGWMIPWKW